MLELSHTGQDSNEVCHSRLPLAIKNKGEPT